MRAYPEQGGPSPVVGWWELTTRTALDDRIHHQRLLPVAEGRVTVNCFQRIELVKKQPQTSREETIQAVHDSTSGALP